MCGIAGVIHRDGAADIGAELTAMLQSMKHRGPDSTGYAVYGPADDLVVIRFVLAEPLKSTGFGMEERLERSRAEVEGRLAKIGAEVATITSDTGYAFRATIRYSGDLKALADYLEDVPGCEVLSLGSSLEIIKDLGDAATVSDQYGLGSFRGTHGIGHVRMATESEVDLASAHPYWAYPYNDIAVVHNGQITNYWLKRRQLEREAIRGLGRRGSLGGLGQRQLVGGGGGLGRRRRGRRGRVVGRADLAHRAPATRRPAGAAQTGGRARRRARSPPA